MSSLIDRLIVKIMMNIENDNQDKAEKCFKEYIIHTKLGKRYVNKEEHNKLCIDYANYQLKKTKEESILGGN